MTITFIGDLHIPHTSEFSYYENLTRKHEKTVQIGDFGFGKEWTRLGYTVDGANHKVLGGNHDDYDVAPNTPNWLGDYGICDTLGIPFFFIRGGHSIDSHDRIFKEHTCGVKSYWHNEELNFAQMLECARDYGYHCPDVVVSHDCPAFVNDMLHGDDSRPNILEKHGWPHDYKNNTALLLDELWGGEFAPRLWIFGHHHISFRKKYGPTTFVGLAIGETYTLEEE